MKVHQPIKLFCPSRVLDTINQYVKSRPENYVFLVHYLLMIPNNDKRLGNNFAPINRKKIEKLFNCKPDKYINFLEKCDFIESDKEFKPGIKAKYYRINPSVEFDCNTYDLQPGTPLFKSLYRDLKISKSHLSKLPYHLNVMRKHFQNLEFDHEGAMQWISNEPDAQKRLSYSISVSQLADKRFRYFKRNNTNNRLDTNLTNLKKELRQFIVGDYVSIDLKNSQPFFLSILAEITFQIINQKDNIKHPPLCTQIGIKDVIQFFGIQCFKSLSKSRQNRDFSNFATLWSFKEAVLSGKFYDDFLQKFDGNLTRDEIKKIVFEVLFSKNEVYYGFKRFTPFEKEKQIFASVYPEVHEIIETLKKKDNSKLAIFLQRIESRIFIDVIAKELVTVGIVPLTVHDSVIVPTQLKDEAMAIIRQVFTREFGVIPTFSIEPLKPKK